MRLATVLRHIGCCWLKFDHFQTEANNTQHVATHRSKVAKHAQHVAPNNVAICCVGVLRWFGRGLIDLSRILLQCVRTIASERDGGGHLHAFTVFLSILTSAPLFVGMRERSISSYCSLKFLKNYVNSSLFKM